MSKRDWWFAMMTYLAFGFKEHILWHTILTPLTRHIHRAHNPVRKKAVFPVLAMTAEITTGKKRTMVARDAQKRSHAALNISGKRFVMPSSR